MALDRAAALLHRLSRATVRFAVASAIGGALVWWALFREAGATDLVLLLAGVLLAAPPAVLLLFSLGARSLASLPRRLREAPGAFAERAAAVRRHAEGVAEARRRGAVAAVPSLLRLLWEVSSSREVLEVLPPGAVLLTPGMLLGSALAALAAVVEVLAGVAALVWLSLG